MYPAIILSIINNTQLTQLTQSNMYSIYQVLSCFTYIQFIECTLNNDPVKSSQNPLATQKSLSINNQIGSRGVLSHGQHLLELLCKSNYVPLILRMRLVSLVVKDNRLIIQWLQAKYVTEKAGQTKTKHIPESRCRNFFLKFSI